jgi:hypothetical protein
MRWVCKYATGRKEYSFRPMMYAGMLREDLFLEPYDDGSGTKIEDQVLYSNHSLRGEEMLPFRGMRRRSLRKLTSASPRRSLSLVPFLCLTNRSSSSGAVSEA